MYLGGSGGPIWGSPVIGTTRVTCTGVLGRQSTAATLVHERLLEPYGHTPGPWTFPFTRLCRNRGSLQPYGGDYGQP